MRSQQLFLGVGYLEERHRLLVARCSERCDLVQKRGESHRDRRNWGVPEVANWHLTDSLGILVHKGSSKPYSAKEAALF